MCLLDAGDLEPIAVEDCGAEDKDRHVDEKRRVQRNRRIDQVVAASGRLARRIGADLTRLHQRRVEVQVVRHDRRAEDADRDVQRSPGHVRHEPREHRRRVGAGQEDLEEEASSDRHHHRQDNRLHLPHPPLLEPQQQERVERRDQAPPEHRHAEEELQRDDRAQHLGQVTGGNRNLGQHPEHRVDGERILGAAGLRQVVLGHHPEPRRQRLKEHGHHVRHQQDPDQRITKPCAPLQISRPVARVHVPDTHQVRRPQEREQPAQRIALRHRDRPMHLLQRAPLQVCLCHQGHRTSSSRRN